MKNKKKIILVVFYLALVGLVYFTSSTLSKYVTTNNTTGDFTIGDKLYFDYTRGDLYRGDQLIVGVPIEENTYDDYGNLKSSKKRVETMNVAPGDTLKFHFYVSNVSEDLTEYNGIEGEFHVSASAILSMPVHQADYQLSCTLTYREVPKEGTPGTFTDLARDKNIDLLVYDGTDETKKLYEFQVYVVLDDQIQATSNDDYVGATLSIYLFVDAANK